jgi:hypothetical protein
MYTAVKATYGVEQERTEPKATIAEAIDAGVTMATARLGIHLEDYARQELTANKFLFLGNGDCIIIDKAA